MKKMIALLLAALMICAMFTGCGEKGTTLKSVQKAGKLTIATSPDFPPFESLGDNNEVVGIEIDVLNLICEQLGVTLEINQMDFDSVLPGVQAGKFDVGVSGISVTEKRQKNVLFTDPYCLAAQAIVVTEGSSITCKADLEGKKVSVQTGTTAESFCMDNGYDVSSFAANSDAQTALTSGKVDAWVIDDLTAADMVVGVGLDGALFEDRAVEEFGGVGDELLQLLGRQQRGGSAAEIDRAQLLRRQESRFAAQFVVHRLHDGLHRPQVGRLVEVAVGADTLAEGDMEIESGHFDV